MSLKGILKLSAGQDAPTDTQTEDRDRRNLELATQHATLLQQQKDIELKILQSIEMALELPTSPNAVSAAPSLRDASRFVDLIIPFQPSDYDCLIEERNAAGKCGYTLCSRRPKKETAKFRIMKGVTGTPLDIVPKESLERWCSEDCARRALYVRVQLDEEPAWTRRAETSTKISLKVNHDGEQHLHPSNLGWLKPHADPHHAIVNGSEAIEKAMKNLSLAKDVVEAAPTTAKSPNQFTQESRINGPTAASRLEDNNYAQTNSSIDGYIPKYLFSGSKALRREH